MFTKQYVIAQSFVADKAESVLEKMRNEDGEVASQIIVMAMLVGVAAVVVGAKDDLTSLADQIVSDVN